ncbi:hypothetical protein GALMADRAFT_236978 [Galerina marginata CBS 339.88]|uniref:Ubiquitin-like domain-containing protein n=1 Tax=Galerina marginata (strain CBS 339.88) TaxID=685588 RepID=A0A067TM62_GALM3|nr:hypothetical protein GALMADRAFT_236978 [Galerina marginata CBS 339.88]
MPPRVARVYHIQVKTHKLTIMLSSLAPATTIAELKAETLSALGSDVASDALDFQAMEPPQLSIETEEDFELCRGKREKGKLTGEYEILETAKMLRETGLTAWEAIFLQPRDKSTGELVPINYTLPSMYDEEDETPTRQTEATNNKGKRKANDMDEE